MTDNFLKEYNKLHKSHPIKNRDGTISEAFVSKDITCVHYHKSSPKGNLLHREDGPARIYANGIEEYWLEGGSYSKEGYILKLRQYKLDQILS